MELVLSKRDAQSIMRNTSIDVSLLTQDADLVGDNPLIARHDFRAAMRKNRATYAFFSAPIQLGPNRSVPYKLPITLP